jgi:hypothetical protein
MTAIPSTHFRRNLTAIYSVRPITSFVIIENLNDRNLAALRTLFRIFQNLACRLSLFSNTIDVLQGLQKKKQNV